MDRTYYESIGFVNETFEEGYISENTKNGLINKIKKFKEDRDTIKAIRKNKSDMDKHENRKKMLSNLSSAIRRDFSDDGKEYDKKVFGTRDYDNAKKRFNRTFDVHSRIHEKIDKNHNDIMTTLNKDSKYYCGNPELYKKALKKK